MRWIAKIIPGILIIVFASCEGFNEFFPQSTFDRPYQKSNINLENEIGSYLVIKKETDTLYLYISSLRNNNVIKDLMTGDTLFKGKISRYKGLYYFTQQVNDTIFWIYAVKLQKHLVSGIGEGHEQALRIDEEILKGNYSQIVKYIDTSHHFIRLHPDPEALNKLFKVVLGKMSPDTILYRMNPLHIPKPTEL